MVDGIFGGVGDVLAGRVGQRRLRCFRRRQGLDSRLTAKHGGGTVVVVVVVVVVVGRAIAWNATDASLDDTVDGIFGVDVLVVRVRVCVRVLIDLL